MMLLRRAKQLSHHGFLGRMSFGFLHLGHVLTIVHLSASMLVGSGGIQLSCFQTPTNAILSL
jgi:hypothetical protein